MSGSDQPSRVGEDVLGDRYLTGDLLRRQDGFAVGNRVQLGHGRSGRSPGDLEQLLLRRKGNQQLEEEPIELRLRQRIGSFQLDRVLGRQHKERFGKLSRLGAHGDRPLLHGFQQRTLGSGGGPVDLVREHQVGKDRTGLVLKVAPAFRLPDDVGAHDIGRHQVRCELDPREIQLQCLAERTDQHCLSQPGHAFHQHVASCQQGDHRASHQVPLPDYQLA